MHAIYAAVLALAATCASAASTSTGPRASASFKLRASSVGTDDLRGWPIQHAHVSAGEDLLILQRPTAFTASDAFLNGTLRQDKNDMQRLAFGNKKPGQIPYEVRLPSVPLGVVREVVAKPGTGTAAFNVHSGQAVVYGDLLIDGQKRGFWACPKDIAGVGEVFTLYFGSDVKKENLPSEECLPVTVEAFNPNFDFSS